MRNNILRIALFILLAVVLYSVGRLSYEHATSGDVCPIILRVPACYIILVSVSVALIAHWLRRKTLFYVFAGIPLLFALMGAAGELLGDGKCPQTASGIPMCYISLGFFVVIFVLKMFENRAK